MNLWFTACPFSCCVADSFLIRVAVKKPTVDMPKTSRRIGSIIMEDVSEEIEKAPREIEARQWAPADERRRGKLGWGSVMGPTELDSAPVGKQSSPDTRSVKAMDEGKVKSGWKTDTPGKDMERKVIHSAMSGKWKKVINDWAKFAKSAAKKWMKATIQSPKEGRQTKRLHRLRGWSVGRKFRKPES